MDMGFRYVKGSKKSHTWLLPGQKLQTGNEWEIQKILLVVQTTNEGVTL